MHFYTRKSSRSDRRDSILTVNNSSPTYNQARSEINNHATLSSPVDVTSRPSLIKHLWVFRPHGRTVAAGISLLGGADQRLRIYEISQFSASCREVSRDEVFEKNPISAACTSDAILSVIAWDSW